MRKAIKDLDPYKFADYRNALRDYLEPEEMIRSLDQLWIPLIEENRYDADVELESIMGDVSF